MISSILVISTPAHAATNSTLNFQARILQSSGALVADGNYNVEFKIYDNVLAGATAQGVCSGNCLWMETRTGASVVRVVNGYVTANLGSVTAFGSTIPWDQDLYITMRVGGIGSPSWDTEMVNATTGRMKMSAVSYAFRSAALMNLAGTAGFNADQLVQLGPSSPQSVSSAGSAISVNQTGAGTLLDLKAGGTSKFSVDAVGNTNTSGTLTISGLTSLQGGAIGNGVATSTTATASAVPGVNTTTITTSVAHSFAINDVLYVQNAGQSYYTRVTAVPTSTSVTVSPQISYDASASITKYTIQNIGATPTDYTTLSKRFFQGYFLGGVVVGAGSTTLSDGILSRTTGDLTLKPGAGGAIQVQGTLNATALTGDGSGLTSINGAQVSGAGITSLNATNISSGTLADTRLSGNVALLTGTQTFSAVKTFGAGLTITSGQNFTVGGQTFTGLTGTGLTFNSNTLNVSYGSIAGTAVQGNVSLTCASGSGNLTGGGNAIILGAGGTCGAISTNNAVSFSTSVTTPSLIGTGALSIASTGANTINIDTGLAAGITIGGSLANTLTLGNASTATTINGATVVLGTSIVRRTAAGTTNYEFNDTSNTTLNIRNTDPTAVANVAIEGALTASSIVGNGSGITALNATNVASGTLSDVRLSGNIATLTGTQTFSGAKTFGAGAVVTTGQSITVNGDVVTDLTGNGIVLNSGALTVDTSDTGNGFVRFAQSIAQIDSSTNQSLFINKTGASGNILELQKNGAGVFIVGNSGALTISNTSTTALDIQSSGGTSTFSVDTSGNIVRVGPLVADPVGVIFVLDNKNTSGDPAGQEGAQYYNSKSATFRCYQAPRGWTDCLGTSKPNSRRSTRIDYQGSGTIFAGQGDIITAAANTTTGIGATTAEPATVSYATSNANNNLTSVSGNLNYSSSNTPSYQTYVQLTSIVTERVWIGITNQSSATMGTSSNPAGNYAAFRYDTSVAGETTWKCVTKDNAIQTISDSAVTVSNAAGVKFEIIETSTDVVFKINGLVVCDNTTNLPTAGTMLRYSNSVTNLVNASHSMKIAWFYLDTDF
jgi:hypothetical protein